MSLALILSLGAGILALFSVYFQNKEDSKEKDKLLDLNEKLVVKSDSIAAKNDLLAKKSDEIAEANKKFAQSTEEKSSEILRLSQRLQISNEKIAELSDAIRNEQTGGDVIPIVTFSPTSYMGESDDQISIRIWNKEQYSVQDIMISIHNSIGINRGSEKKNEEFRYSRLYPDSHIDVPDVAKFPKNVEMVEYIVHVWWRNGHYVARVEAFRNQEKIVVCRVEAINSIDKRNMFWKKKYTDMLILMNDEWIIRSE